MDTEILCWIGLGYTILLVLFISFGKFLKECDESMRNQIDLTGREMFAKLMRGKEDDIKKFLEAQQLYSDAEIAEFIANGENLRIEEISLRFTSSKTIVALPPEFVYVAKPKARTES